MEYREVVKRDRTEIELLLHRTEATDVLDALLSATYYDPDWKWVQGQCLAFLGHGDRSVRRLSATCLGHLARIHKQLELELVLSRLTELKDDPEIGDSVQDALDDIRFYLSFQ
jgi:hypothetical protein